MANWDMTKRQVNSDGKIISTGQKTTPLFDDNSNLEERVSNIENKLDKIVKLLENIKND